ncbi:MAG: ABC transporter permease [Parachlamydiales bacterium]|nr:ABC transporter permease [Parachlamydiales bacterium]
MNDGFSLLWPALLETLYMVSVSCFFAFLIGLPLGILLTITGKGHLRPNPFVNKLLGFIVNIGRSFPFAILLVAILPLTRWIVGTSLGTTSAIVPLTIAAIPFVARVVESALKEVDRSLMEAAIVLGCSLRQIIYKVLLVEALPALINGATLTFVSVIGYSAMAGLVGGGGLGKVAIQYGYQRFNPTIMVSTVVLLIAVVQGVEWIGSFISKRLYLKRGKELNT